jgi:Ca-activated chloride channel family protein
MGAMDFDPLTRFEAAREVVKEFIANRSSDRLGLVVFAAQSFTLCPLTLDYDILRQFLEDAWEARIDDGTAIGSALATSVNRLRESDAKSRVIILLTDGMNNRGNIDPLTAARMAAALGIRVYTIGVGTEGQAPQRMEDGRVYMVETHIDEDTLRKVADATGGKYYRAKNVRELQGIYQEIGALETTRINVREWVEYDEKYPLFLMGGMILLVLSFILDRTVFRRIP